MKIVKTPISDLYIIEPNVFNDDRGYFFESYNQKIFDDFGLKYNFVQDNESKSTYGVVRGLHYQLSPFAQTKLVRAVKGRVWDVAVDIRKKSSTYGKWFAIELSDENKKQLLIPAGFAHGFSVLSDEAVFAYKCDQFYSKNSERGIKFNDPTIAVDWKIPEEKMIVSEKDWNNPEFVFA